MADDNATAETTDGGSNQAAGGRRAARSAAGPVKRADVVSFTAVDAHTGDEYGGLGVVASTDGGTVTVRPLADYTVQALDAEPIAVDES